MTLTSLGLTGCILMFVIGAATGAASGDLIANDNGTGVGVRRLNRLSPTTVGVWAIVVNVVAAFTAMGLLLVNFNSDPELRVALIALVGSELLGLAMTMFTWGVVLSTEPLHPRK